MKQRLFEEPAQDGVEEIRVNEQFARRFEHNKRREELHRLQEKHPEVAARLAGQAALAAAKQSCVGAAAAGDVEPDSELDESESSSEEEEEEEDLEDDTDKVLETLVRIKRHDPALYQPDTVIFPQQQQSDEEGDVADAAAAAAAAGVTKGVSNKPVYLRTVLARQALEGGPVDDDDADDPAAAAAAIPSGPVSGSYASEQAALKAAFLAAAQDADAGLELTKPAAAAATAAAAEGDHEGKVKARDVNKLLTEYFGPDKSLDPADAFLKTYLANKAWKQPVNGSSSRKRSLKDFGSGSSSDDDDEGDVDDHAAAAAGDDEEDEQFLEEADRFEAAYNFRFEEPGAAKIPSFPRVIADSVRRKDDRRKRQRDAKAARLEEEKATREAELRRLKNLKKDAIQDMVSRIQQEAGMNTAKDGDNAGAVPDVLADLLEGEFDPEEYDKRMAAAFGDGYYQGSDDADELFGDHEEELGAEADLETPAETFPLGSNPSNANNHARSAATDGFAALRQKQKQQQEEEANAEAVAEQREQLQRLLEDYYKLDYEDNIGGMPCRFRYRQVESESFGLSAADVLTLSDKQLNSVVGLKLLAPYREGYKKLRPNYKALQDLKGEAAAAAVRKQQQRKHKKRKQQQDEGEGQQQQQQGVDVSESWEGRKQKLGYDMQQQQHARQDKQQQHAKKEKKQKEHQQHKPAGESTAEQKQAARLASYAKLSLKPTKEQKQQRDNSDGSGKQAKKKRKLGTDGEQQQDHKAMHQPGRLAAVQLEKPLTKAQKKNLLRSLKRKERHLQ